MTPSQTSWPGFQGASPYDGRIRREYSGPTHATVFVVVVGQFQ
ncbi:MAG TPA: hypothetical protein VK132_02765 [Gemmatimonadales bacterium]|nr:hypothetical protein [Gemmatimonadales bacterium]